MMPVAEFARKWAKAIIVVAAALVLLLTAWRCAVSWPRGTYLSNNTGEWLTLGDDLRHGEFYRPILSAQGYGGTRYFPLQPALLGGLMELGLPPITAGFALTFISAAVLIGGVAAFLRRLGAPGWFALSVGLLSLANGPVQLVVTTFRGDLLPAALSLWGLAFCASLRGEDRLGRLAAPALFFALAFSAKATSVFGVGASVIWLWTNGRQRQALHLALLTAAFSAVLLGAADAASGGRFLENLSACAAGGGTWSRVLRAPYEMMYNLSDAVLMLFVILAGIALWVGGRNFLRELAPIYLAVTVLGTGAILTTPGIILNHFVDMFVGLVVVAAAGAAQRRMSMVLGGVLLAVICVIAAAISTAQKFHADRIDRIATYRRVVQAAGQGEKPLLADDAVFPLIAEERPVIMVDFMLRVLAQDHPEIASDLQERVARRAFRAVVMIMPKHSAAPPRRAVGTLPDALAEMLGRATAEHQAEHISGLRVICAKVLDQAYYPAAWIDGYSIYLPRPSATVAPAEADARDVVDAFRDALR